MSLITCSNVSVGYENKVVLSELSFQLNQGEYLCVVGENGAGKSTLLKTILGLKQPRKGEIQFGDGLEQNEIGYLPQQSMIQKDFPASVEEIIRSGCLSQGVWKLRYNKKDRIKVKKYMELLGLEELKKKSYSSLSGGQQQRVLLARALCATKKLVVLDEPVAGLDPIITEEFYELIDKINKEEKITILMITHDIKQAVPYATHILHLGKEVFFGSMKEYSRSGIGQTYTKGVQV